MKSFEIKKQIKPLSVNDCWQGRRYKTKEYKMYEMALFYTLPNIEIPKPPYLVSYEFGFSSAGSDYDNVLKPLQDILQKKYKFNDNDILEARIKKIKVKKGNEYFAVKIESLDKEEILL